MIIGTGLIPNGFKSAYTHREDVCIYAARVAAGVGSDNWLAASKGAVKMTLSDVSDWQHLFFGRYGEIYSIHQEVVPINRTA